MRLIWLSGLFGWGMVAAVALATGAIASESEGITVAVVSPSPDDQHLAWEAARHLQEVAKHKGLKASIEPASRVDAAGPLPELIIMQERRLATQVPELQILELPFFYPTLESVHGALDGDLGQYLDEKARSRGWQIIAFWDEGMHVFSGLKRFDRVRNLKAREFLVTRPDPVVEKQFNYWKGSARRIDPQDRETVLSECLIAGRAATLQEIVREELYRVHLAISLSNHRYEGWVLVSPGERWSHLDAVTRERLNAVARETTAWQRRNAQEREAAALAKLKRRGMSIHEVDSEEREAFRQALPDWTELLANDLDEQQKRKLIRLALTGAATVPGSGITFTEARGNFTPGSETRQDNNGGR